MDHKVVYRSTRGSLNPELRTRKCWAQNPFAFHDSGYLFCGLCRGFVEAQTPNSELPPFPTFGMRAQVKFIYIYIYIITASGSSSSQVQVPLLSEKSYDSWYIRMRTILRSQDLWTYVIDGYAEPVNAVAELALSSVDRVLLKENRKKDNKALGLIQQGLNESIFTKISSVTSWKMAWDILETCYQGVSKVKTVKLQNLRRDFENLKMKDNESEDAFMTQVMSIVNQLWQYGDDVEYNRVIEKLLRSLPKKFEPVVVPIE